VREPASFPGDNPAWCGSSGSRSGQPLPDNAVALWNKRGTKFRALRARACAAKRKNAVVFAVENAVLISRVTRARVCARKEKNAVVFRFSDRNADDRFGCQRLTNRHDLVLTGEVDELVSLHDDE
jgi:hypothetical protein